MALALAACGGSDQQQQSSAPPPAQSCVLPLFQNWHLVSFTPTQPGAQGIAVLSLVGGHYGPGQPFSTTNGCSYTIDIERGAVTSNSEQGTATLSNPSPASCAANAGTTNYTLTCSSLSLSDSAGIGTYNPG